MKRSFFRDDCYISQTSCLPPVTFPYNYSDNSGNVNTDFQQGHQECHSLWTKDPATNTRLHTQAYLIQPVKHWIYCNCMTAVSSIALWAFQNISTFCNSLLVSKFWLAKYSSIWRLLVYNVRSQYSLKKNKVSLWGSPFMFSEHMAEPGDDFYQKTRGSFELLLRENDSHGQNILWMREVSQPQARGQTESKCWFVAVALHLSPGEETEWTSE